jgi:excisionase family DNA binding protein
MTVAEIATILKLNQQTVRNWIDTGKLPALRIGRRVRVTRADFDRLIGQAERPRGETRVSTSIWDGEIPMPEIPVASDAQRFARANHESSLEAMRNLV